MTIDLMKLTPEQLDRFIHLQSIVARQQGESERIRALRDYYKGDHPVFLSDRQKEYLGKDLTEGEFPFAHNVVKPVLDTLRERLSVAGFTVNGAGVEDTTEGGITPEAGVAQLFWAWWEENQMDAQQIRLYRRTLRDGKSYVMVDYDNENQRPRFTLHKVDDGTTGIQLHRDPEHPERILFANKYWYTFNPLEPGKTGLARKTTYLPNQIRKYILGKKGEWEPYAEEDGGVWPLPWVDPQTGESLGITAIEFENPGGSEVAQIIGLQNLLNKTWLDLGAAADAAGFPILVTEYEPGASPDQQFGTVTDDDDIEDEDEFHIAPGRMLEVEGRIHRIEIADLGQLINAINLIVGTVAGQTRTPQYYLRPMGGNDVPSGESLKQLESGLVSRAVERQLLFGQRWGDVMGMAYRVARAFGPPLPEVAKLRCATVWESPETRHEKTDAETGQLHKNLGIPDEEIWAKLGYSPAQIARFKATQRSEQATTIATIAQNLGRVQPGQNPPAPPNRPPVTNGDITAQGA